MSPGPNACDRDSGDIARGVRVVLTQPLPRVQAIAQSLLARGHEVLCLPVRRLRSRLGDPGVREQLGRALQSDWLVFVSPGTVEAAWPALTALADQQPGAVSRFAAIGPGTAAALRARLSGWSVVPEILHPEGPRFDADALLAMAPFAQPRGLRITVLRGESGRDDWLDTLRRQGAALCVIAVHASEALLPDPVALEEAGRWLASCDAQGFGRAPPCLVFTSRDAIDRLSAALPMQGRTQARALTVHPALAEHLHRRAWKKVELIAPGQLGLIAGIESVRDSPTA